jgi:hypothetical protein
MVSMSSTAVTSEWDVESPHDVSPASKTTVVITKNILEDRIPEIIAEAPQ